MSPKRRGLLFYSPSRDGRTGIRPYEIPNASLPKPQTSLRNPETSPTYPANQPLFQRLSWTISMTMFRLRLMLVRYHTTRRLSAHNTCSRIAPEPGWHVWRHMARTRPTPGVPPAGTTTATHPTRFHLRPERNPDNSYGMERNHFGTTGFEGYFGGPNVTTWRRRRPAWMAVQTLC